MWKFSSFLFLIAIRDGLADRRQICAKRISVRKDLQEILTGEFVRHPIVEGCVISSISHNYFMLN